MNKYVQMILFALVMGAITSVLLIGMTSLTEDRIQENKEAGLKSAILDVYNIEYSFSTVNETFDDYITTEEYDGLTYYINNDTSELSFQFDGSGLWGPIIGIITLENDVTTIKDITILQQEETPGLGGVVADRNYLNNFVGKVFDIDITKTADSTNLNQVDAITGATGTSNAFEIIINDAYDLYHSTWVNNHS